MAKTSVSKASRTPTTAGVLKAPKTPKAPKPPKAEAAEAPARKATRARLPKAVATAVQAAFDKKATDVVVLDLRKAGGFTDYFVICTGDNTRQINAVADAVREALRTELGERPTLAEGKDKSEWILLDYFNFVVHVFSRECRAFYDLERLWGNAVSIPVQDRQPA